MLAVARVLPFNPNMSVRPSDKGPGPSKTRSGIRSLSALPASVLQRLLLMEESGTRPSGAGTQAPAERRQDRPTD